MKINARDYVIHLVLKHKRSIFATNEYLSSKSCLLCPKEPLTNMNSETMKKDLRELKTDLCLKHFYALSYSVATLKAVFQRIYRFSIASQLSRMSTKQKSKCQKLALENLVCRFAEQKLDVENCSAMIWWKFRSEKSFILISCVKKLICHGIFGSILCFLRALLVPYDFLLCSSFIQISIHVFKLYFRGYFSFPDHRDLVWQPSLQTFRM